ncbi:SLC35F6 [Branchiostoma lanceolatum]|uniref:SLC35F6 protein n=1 Tax=Branchiostoma lanceolatum TaxID=7740 RepID=A0A8J9ZX27_BRALA|nr:SLC35F6 [Branchiostoma lanceolatum]
MALSCVQWLLVLGMLVTGSINTLSKKAQNDSKVKGVPGPNGTEAVEHDFDHPWFQTVIMFIGEMCCLIGLFIQRKRERDQFRKQIMQDFNQEPIEALQQGRVFQFIFAVPTICDLFGTTLAGIGLLWVNASVWQMLRGSIIIFTGILSKIFLKRKLRGIHWTGMVVTMLGLVLVGVSSIFNEEDNDKKDVKKSILGIVLILAGQVVSSSQMIIEELFLKKRKFPPLQVVGMEGTFGVFFMVALVLPVLYFIPGDQPGGRYENSIDALYQIYNSPGLLVFCLLYLFSIAFYNYFGLAVTKSLTAVHRTLIDACRTIMVWLVSLFIHYAVSKDFGEPWDNTYGILQVDGFFFLMIGTALYNELISFPWIPCLRPQPPEEASPTPQTASIQGTQDSDERTPLLGGDT